MGRRADIPFPQFADQVCIVLVNPQFDGNIGAVARSMLNFGFSDLRVVGHDGHWSTDTRNRAKHAQLILDRASTLKSLEEAIHDCSIVVGTSGKREDGEKTATRHFLLPDELPDRLRNVEGKVAIVFGPEGKGLLNAELSSCDLLVTIPTWEGYPILNLSHAVSILCYQWYCTAEVNAPMGAESRLLDPELRRKLRIEISRLTSAIPTREHRRKGIEETLNRVVMRGLPKDDEIHRLIGVVSEAADAFERQKTE